jgi:uncharacterized protein YdiU (UPF0061 family)
LGLQTANTDDINKVIIPLLGIMHQAKVDYTHFMRDLAETPLDQVANVLSRQSNHLNEALTEDWQHWCTAYTERVRSEWSTQDGSPQEQDAARLSRMQKVNPKFILRNWMAQECIQRAEAGDEDCVRELLELVATQKAFEEGQPEDQRYAGPVPEVCIRVCAISIHHSQYDIRGCIVGSRYSV